MNKAKKIIVILSLLLMHFTNAAHSSEWDWPNKLGNPNEILSIFRELIEFFILDLPNTYNKIPDIKDDINNSVKKLFFSNADDFLCKDQLLLRKRPITQIFYKSTEQTHENSSLFYFKEEVKFINCEKKIQFIENIQTESKISLKKKSYDLDRATVDLSLPNDVIRKIYKLISIDNNSDTTLISIEIDRNKDNLDNYKVEIKFLEEPLVKIFVQIYRDDYNKLFREFKLNYSNNFNSGSCNLIVDEELNTKKPNIYYYEDSKKSTNLISLDKFGEIFNNCTFTPLQRIGQTIIQSILQKFPPIARVEDILSKSLFSKELEEMIKITSRSTDGNMRAVYNKLVEIQKLIKENRIRVKDTRPLPRN